MNTEHHKVDGADSMNAALDEGYLGTLSGRKSYPANPEKSYDMIDIEEVAHALSLQCRFGGHVTHFYSVAQHSVNCTRLARLYGYEEPLVYACLMHDAHEAYLCDVPTPIKLLFGSYYEYEKLWEAVFAKKFKIPHYDFDLIKRVDVHSLFQEANRLQPNNVWSDRSVGELPDDIFEMTPEEAREAVLDEFYMLTAHH